ncbi:MAG: hypothetical protein OXH39_12005 [Candidatus Poribacteria bacterium]|nr:hypothetical protein [Candidatus Poribacteria bacterium]
MASIAKIQEEILALSETDYQQLRQWFNELDKDEWDRQIEEDSNAGKLDFLIAEALEAKKKGTLKNLEDLSENHPLVSLMEVIETLIEKYESEQESLEREAWSGLSMQMLARAYGEDEPEYTTDMLKWVNPDYEGK